MGVVIHAGVFLGSWHSWGCPRVSSKRINQLHRTILEICSNIVLYTWVRGTLSKTCTWARVLYFVSRVENIKCLASLIDWHALLWHLNLDNQNLMLGVPPPPSWWWWWWWWWWGTPSPVHTPSGTKNEWSSRAPLHLKFWSLLIFKGSIAFHSWNLTWWTAVSCPWSMQALRIVMWLYGIKRFWWLLYYYYWVMLGSTPGETGNRQQDSMKVFLVKAASEQFRTPLDGRCFLFFQREWSSFAEWVVCLEQKIWALWYLGKLKVKRPGSLEASRMPISWVGRNEKNLRISAIRGGEGGNQNFFETVLVEILTETPVTTYKQQYTTFVPVAAHCLNEKATQFGLVSKSSSCIKSANFHSKSQLVFHRCWWGSGRLVNSCVRR